MEKQAPTQTRQNQTSRKPAESAGAQTASEAGLAALVGFDQALSGSDGRTQNQAARLSDRRIAPIQRASLASRIGRLQGNRHLQQVLAGLGQPYGVIPAGPPTTRIQRQEGAPEGDEPTPEQKAAAKAAAQAAEAQAGGTAQQAKAATSQSKAAGKVEKQAGTSAKQKASQAKSGAAAAKAKGVRAGKKKRGPAGKKATGGAGTARGAARAGAAGLDQAPASPEEDPAFQQVTGRVKQAGKREKKHAPAGKKASEAQAAAQVPAKETTARAQANQAGAIEAAPTPRFDAAAFKAALMARIAAMAPKTTAEADNFKSNNKLSSVKSEMTNQAGAATANARQPMESAAEQAPDTSAVPARPASPLPPAEAGPAPAIAGAAGAAPKPKTTAQVEKPIQENARSLDEQMRENDITEEQLARSNEPEFKKALDAKKDAKTQAETGPQAYRQAEQETLGQAQAEAGNLAQAHTQGMHADRQALLTQVSGQQGAAKTKDEQERQRVGAEINTIYQQTKSKVESILSALDSKVTTTFDRGAAEAKQAFEDYVDARVEAYKQRRYGGWFGWARWAKDKLLGMPSEVNTIYQRGRQLFIAKMDAVIDNVVAIIGAGLSEAKAEIANGKKRIQEYLAGLPENLQEYGQQAAKDIQGKFDSLESKVDSKQNELIDSLASKYNETLSAVDARIEELKAANQGLVQKAFNAIAGVIRTILKLKTMLTSVLAKAAGLVGKILKDPIGFLGNLISGIKQGFTNFVGNIVTHLKTGLIGWLTGALGEAGIQIPADPFSLKGIFSLVTQILGMTWANLRAKAVKLLGEPVVAALEKGFELFQILMNEGPAGLWRYLKEQLASLKDMVIEEIKSMVITEVIKAGVKWILGLLNPAGALVKAAMAIYDIVSFFIERGSQVIQLMNAVIDAVAAIAGGAIGGAASLVENALSKALPVVIGFLANLLGLGGLAKRIQGIIAKVRGKVDQAIDWVLEKARKAAGPLLAKMGIGKDGKEQAGAKKASADQKVTVEDTKKAEKGDFTAKDRKAGLAAFASEERSFVKDGQISQQDAKKVAGSVKKKYPVFQSITVIDGKDSWDYQYVFKANAVDTPSSKSEDGRVNVTPIRGMFADKDAIAFLNSIHGMEFQKAAGMLANRGVHPEKLTNASILKAIKESLKQKGLVNVDPIRKYRPGWSDQMKEELAAIYPEQHLSGSVRIVYEKALSKKGRLYNRAIFNRNHMTAYSDIRNDLLNRLQGASIQEAMMTLRQESHGTLVPKGESNQSVLEAAKAVLRDKFNDIANVYLGDARENQKNGREMAIALKNMEQAANSGNQAAFDQAKQKYLAMGFDPEPIEYFYDKFNAVRERI